MAAHRKAKERMRPNEWYTPRHIIEIARGCMGAIDLDPASCAVANETVRARTFYDIKKNGLKQPWFGKVFMNPPYGRIGPAFVQKVVREAKAGTIEQAVVLININHLATTWFVRTMQIEHLLCPPGREPRINLTLFIDAILPLRRQKPPKPKAPKQAADDRRESAQFNDDLPSNMEEAR